MDLLDLIDGRRRNAKRYFASMPRHVDARLLAEVQDAIAERGHWERTREWRISTCMTSRIERVEGDQGRRWYRVTVENGTNVSCHCPTIARALHFVGLFETLTMDLFHSEGWSSWADKERVEPGEGET